MTQKCSPIKNSIPFCAIYFTCNGKNSNVNAKLLYAIGAKIYKMAYVNHYGVKKRSELLAKKYANPKIFVVNNNSQAKNNST